MKLTVPAITPEQLYLQDKRRREWEEENRKTERFLARYFAERERNRNDRG